MPTSVPQMQSVGVTTPERANGIAPAAPVEERRGLFAAIVTTMRPRQWLKNGLVVAAAGAAGALGYDDVPVRVGVTCVAFCLLASGLYAVNDVHDLAEDRRHPHKRRRPVAAGELGVRSALGLGVALLILGLAMCTLVRPLVGVVGAGY